MRAMMGRGEKRGNEAKDILEPDHGDIGCDKRTKRRRRGEPQRSYFDPMPERGHYDQRIQREIVKENTFDAQAHPITSCGEFNGLIFEYRVKKVAHN